MKQNYIFCLMGMLSVFNVVFSMEEVPQAVKDFKTAYAAALKFEADGEMDKALVQYGKAANIKLPPATGFLGFAWTYTEEQKNQKLAIEKLEKAADGLTRANKMGEALKIYELAPVTFEDKIEFTKELIKDELATAKTDFDKAQNLINEGKYQEAINILTKFLIPEEISDVVQKAAAKLIDDIEKRQTESGEPTSQKALISALQNLKNGFVQVGKKLASK